ncbi:MAG TPA: hypothetical protein VEC93_20205 [Anaerolineae bacterium]|nr:hypothetical protein [Anaerolineae bacterium]
MPIQECALYGDLVLYLRDQAAEMLTKNAPYSNVEEAKQSLDILIRDWFFTPQAELYSSTPREVIWREQLGQGNPIPPEYAHVAFDDDCPICQGAIAEIEAGEHHHGPGGRHWTYCPDSALIDRYDPEGSEARWLEEWLLLQPQLDPTFPPVETPVYTPPAASDLEVSLEEFMARLNWREQVDENLKQMADRLLDRLDCPTGRGFIEPEYRRLNQKEMVTLLKGLQEQGVDLDELVKQVDAWPYQNVALDWLADPERHIYLTIRGMETRLDPAAKEELIRFRQHRDFLFIFCQIMAYSTRSWLQGWLAGLALANLPKD